MSEWVMVLPRGKAVSAGNVTVILERTLDDGSKETKTEFVFTEVSNDPENRNFVEIYGREFEVVSDDNERFWGEGGKSEYMQALRERNSEFIETWAARGHWDLDENGNPVALPRRFSVAEMASEGKNLMAHLMVEIGIFPSVSQARKNGWDKPLELGLHELGPRKKRVRVLVEE